MSTLASNPELIPATAALARGNRGNFEENDLPDYETIRRQRQERSDAVVESNRVATPAAVTEQREVQRLSIAELNDLDIDQLRRRLEKSRFDDRPPIIRALDLIDLPRNALFNLAAPGIAAAKREEGDTAAAGLGRVNASDVLQELGVENRIVRAVAGFVGDVAFDPLTYVGPAGIGLKLTARTAGSGRQALIVSKAGRRALFNGIRAASKAGTVDAIEDETIRNVVRLAVNDDVLRRGTERFGAEQVESSLRKRLIGSVRETPASRLLPRRSGEGGIIADRLTRQALEPGQLADDIGYVRQFVQQFERNVPGLRIGGGGSQVAHIPFTGLNIQVPAFTAAGRSSLAASAIAKAGSFSPDVAPVVVDVSQRAERLLDALRTEHANVSAERRVFSDEAVQARSLGEAPEADELRAGFEIARQSRRADRDLALENIANLARSLNETTLAIDSKTPEAALALMQVRNVALNAADRADALRHALTLTASEGDFVNRFDVQGARLAQVQSEAASVAPEAVSGDRFNAVSLPPPPPDAEAASAALNQLVNDAQEAIGTAVRLANSTDVALRTFLTPGEREALELVKAALGTNDDTLGASLMTPFIDAAQWALGEDHVTVDYLRSVDRALRTAFGQRSGLAHEAARFAERGHNQASARAFSGVVLEMNQQIQQVARQHDLNPQQQDELYSLMTAVLYSRRERNAQTLWGDVWIEGRGSVPVAEAIDLIDDLPPGVVADHWALRLMQAERGGLLQNPELRASLDEMADRFGVEVLDDFKQIEQDAAALGMSMAAYVPLILTREARNALRSGRSRFRRPQGGGDATVAREAFQKFRTTTQYRFRDPDSGEWHRFFEFDRGGLDDETQAIIKRFDKLVEDGAIDGVGRPTDVFELNALVKSGRFAMLTGGAPLDSGFFESNILSLMGSRAMMHERAMSRRTLIRAIKGGGANLTIDPRSIEVVRNTPNGVATTKNGEVVRISNRRPGGMPAVQIGGKVYRPLSDSAVKQNNPLREMLGELGSSETLWEETVADRFERVARMFGDENEIQNMLGIADWITARWKELTLLHPSWMVTELVGNSVLWLQGGVRGNDIRRHFPASVRLVMNERNPEKLRAMQFSVGGQTISGEELLRQAYETFADASRGAETAAMVSKSFNVPLPGNEAKNVLGNLPQTIKAAMTGKRVGERGVKGLSGGPTPFGDSMWRRVIAPWFRADAMLNNSMRITAYLSFLEQGFDTTTAAQKTIEAMFDMTDLTRFESNRLRRYVLPFYSWVRNNTAYQARMLFQRPVYIANFPRLRDALEEGLAGENRVPEYARPAWLREQLALQIGEDPNERWSILLRSGVPIGDAFDVIAGFMGVAGAQDFMRYLVGSGNPTWKVPIEIASGREIFSRREIGPSSLEGDISVRDALVSQIRPLRETGIGLERDGPLVREFGRSFGAGAGRLVAGGRAQAFDEERLDAGKLREFKDVERRLRIAINRAQRDEDESLSLESRTKLMSLYRRMIEIGFEDDVPRWAKNQLASLDQPPGVE